MGVVRNIGASIGVTTASVVFERRRAEHQLMGYAAYDRAHGGGLYQRRRLVCWQMPARFDPVHTYQALTASCRIRHDGRCLPGVYFLPMPSLNRI